MIGVRFASNAVRALPSRPNYDQNSAGLGGEPLDSTRLELGHESRENER
jgi:hypothetical protein